MENPAPLSLTSLCIYPADVLALWSRRKRLGANYSVSPDKGVMLVQLDPSLFGSDHGGGVGEALHARLLVHLRQSDASHVS